MSKTNSYQLFLTDVTSTGALYRTPGVAASGANTYYSQKMQPDNVGNLGFQLETTGTLNGTFTLWYSDEDQPNTANDTDWVQDTTWSPTNPAGSTTKAKYVVTGLRAKWARVKYVNSSNTGNLFGVGNY